jgi:lysophospholipase L1-like esterase
VPADRPGRGRTAALGLSAVLLALAGCDAASSPPSDVEPPVERPPAASSYVALGDSFTAAPFVPETDYADGCFRSSGNYPAILADALDLDLRDVSCSGADTGDVVGPQAVGDGSAAVPPQLRAVRPGTDLVTVSIGGNDQDVFASLVQGCVRTSGGEESCSDTLEERYGDPRAVIEETRQRVADVLRGVQHRAPRATVVLVGYLRLASEEQGCDLLPLTDEDRVLVADLERSLNDALRRAARDAGVRFVDMHELSEGHEICSDEPWVNGINTDQERALAFHPFTEGQEAVADALLGLVGGAG